MAEHQGWPARLSEGPVGLRPLKRSDARAWSEVRLANEQWLLRWEPTTVATWAEQNTRAVFLSRLHQLKSQARHGQVMPFAVTYEGRFAGQLTIGNIVRGSLQSGYAGYWVDGRRAGRGIIPCALALAIDHCLGPAGLHRVEINIRPENTASRRVVAKLGIREEALHQRLLYIDGAWQDHVGYAVTAEEAGPGGLLARWRSRTDAPPTPAP